MPGRARPCLAPIKSIHRSFHLQFAWNSRLTFCHLLVDANEPITKKQVFAMSLLPLSWLSPANFLDLAAAGSDMTTFRSKTRPSVRGGSRTARENFLTRHAQNLQRPVNLQRWAGLSQPFGTNSLEPSYPKNPANWTGCSGPGLWRVHEGPRIPTG